MLPNQIDLNHKTVTKRRVMVVTYKGNQAAQRGIERMLGKGWDLQDQSVRKVVWSPMTGLFTRKQKHTITFIKDEEVRVRLSRGERKALKTS